MTTPPSTIDAYLAALPGERRELVEAILATIRQNADVKLEEGIQYGMPAFYLPHAAYPAGYHCDPAQPLPFASVAATKSGASIHLFCAYCDSDERARLVTEWKATGKRLDMGKACIRVKRLEQVPLDVVGAAVKRMTAARFVRAYESIVPASVRTAAKKPAKKTASRSPRR